MDLASAALMAWMALCCQEFQVDFAFAQAVARVESGKEGVPLRFGRLGRSNYYGPFGIHRDFLKRWPIDNPYVNVWVGVKALRGKNKRAVLRRYNPAMTEAYYRQICRIERRLHDRISEPN